MDCPKCNGYMNKTEILDWNSEDHLIIITWQASCPYCGYKTMIDEAFESTGWEEEAE